MVPMHASRGPDFSHNSTFVSPTAGRKRLVNKVASCFARCGRPHSEMMLLG